MLYVDPVDGKKYPAKHLNDIEAFELLYGPPMFSRDYSDFRAYQKWMAGKAIEKDVFLGAEMGLGKTGAALYAAAMMIMMGEVSRWLIVAPVKVAEETWPEEIATWAFSRGLSYRIVTGDAKQRLAALQKPAQLTIINRENLRWLHEVLPGRKWDFEGLIYDEASRLKAGKKRTAARKMRDDGTVPPRRLTEMGIMRRRRASFYRVIELSGTPASNGLIDLWGPIYVIDKGVRLGTSLTAYKKRWFREDRWAHTLEPFEHSEKEIMDKISDIFYTLRSEDYLKLPPLIPVPHHVHMSATQQRKYDAFERDMATWVKDNDGSPQLIEAVNKGVLCNKLLQFANGSLYLDDHTDVKVHEHKLDVLESIMVEAMGCPVLVAYSFKFDKEAIKKRFPYVRIYGESPDDMRDWNAGKIKMLLTHPASAGHGLNFQYGAHIAVWYGLTWSLELWQQFIKRLHRPGQTADRVFMHLIVAHGTMDGRVLQKLGQRGMTQDKLMAAVKAELSLRHAA